MTLRRMLGIALAVLFVGAATYDMYLSIGWLGVATVYGGTIGIVAAVALITWLIVA